MFSWEHINMFCYCEVGNYIWPIFILLECMYIIYMYVYLHVYVCVICKKTC